MKKIIIIISFILPLFAYSQWNPVGPGGGSFNAGITINNHGVVATNCGLYKSVSGEQFTPYSKGMPGGDIQSIYNFNNILFASIRLKGIYISRDAGITWQPSTKRGWMYDLSTNFTASNGQLFFKKSFDSIAYTLDTGKTWTFQNIALYNFGEIFAIENALYLYGSSAGTYGLYRSDDKGKTLIKTNIPSNAAIGHVMKIGGTFYSFTTCIFTSSDGLSWSTTGDTIPHPNYPKSAFAPNYYAYDGTYLYGINGGNIYVHAVKWKPGDTKYTLLNSNLSTKGNLTGFFIINNVLVVSRLEETSYSSDQGKSFSPSNLSKIYAIRLSNISTNKNNMASVSESLVYTITDESQELIQNKPSGFYNNSLLNTFIHKDRLILTLVNGFGALETHISSDAGKTSKFIYMSDYAINKLEKVDDTLHFLGSYLDAPFAAILNDSGRVEKTIEAGNVSYYYYFADIVKNSTGKFCLFRKSSLNNITSYVAKYNYKTNYWRLPPAPYSSNTFSANCLESWNEKLYLGTSNKGVLVNSDTIKTWQPFNKGIETLSINDLQARGDTLVAATDSGVYMIKKGETTWANITGNLVIGSIKEVRFSDHHIYARAEGGGAWRLPLNGFVSSIKNNYNTNNYAFSVYPNPTQNQVTINFEKGNLIEYKMALIDLQGRVLYTADNIQNNHIIDLKNYSTGIYLIQLSNADIKLTQKVIIQN